jgi:hypothetical protein
MGSWMRAKSGSSTVAVGEVLALLPKSVCRRLQPGNGVVAAATPGFACPADDAEPSLFDNETHINREVAERHSFVRRMLSDGT